MRSLAVIQHVETISTKLQTGSFAASQRRRTADGRISKQSSTSCSELWRHRHPVALRCFWIHLYYTWLALTNYIFNLNNTFNIWSFGRVTLLPKGLQSSVLSSDPWYNLRHQRYNRHRLILLFYARRCFSFTRLTNYRWYLWHMSICLWTAQKYWGWRLLELQHRLVTLWWGEQSNK